MPNTECSGATRALLIADECGSAWMNAETNRLSISGIAKHFRNILKFIKRLTLILRQGKIAHVFDPIFPPNAHADEVLTWLSSNAV